MTIHGGKFDTASFKVVGTTSSVRAVLPFGVTSVELSMVLFSILRVSSWRRRISLTLSRSPFIFPVVAFEWATLGSCATLSLVPDTLVIHAGKLDIPLRLLVSIGVDDDMVVSCSPDKGTIPLSRLATVE